ncbi:VOC family protein [Niveispirillum fermenti]|uniref:VOC family protein n=1 Tax=Niveispirillum fermenti TaxID=1233113 RepID=UPI003A848505
MVDPRTIARTSLGFFKLVVPDAETSERFYAGTFGMVRRWQVEGPTFREIMLASQDSDFTLVLFQWRDGRALEQGTAHGPVGFRTPDLDTLLQAALDHGARLKHGPIEGSGMKAAFLISPDGHEIELLQRVQAEAA